MSGEPGVLFVIETEPVALPADVGANVTLNEVVCPGLSVCGTVSPVMLNPAPLALPAVIERAAVPVFDNVTDTDPLLPTWRFEKGTLVGFEVSTPCVPIPARAIDIVGFEAFVAIVIVPVATPAVVGANWAVNVAVAPAAMVWPALIPVALKPGPVALTWLTVMVVVPLFVNTIGCVLLVPTTTLLKLKLPGLGVKVPLAVTALPVIVKVCCEPGALSVKTTVPTTPVVDVGVN